MTSTDSPLSSLNSFHTAPSSRSPMPEDRRSKTSQKIQYRPARQLPRELKVQCGIYLNEKLYCAGLALLTNLLTTGATRPNASATPTFVPTPVQIEFIVTLLVHPFNTTNNLPENNPEVASASITLLRNLLSTVGPVNANLKEAFDFTSKSNGRLRRRCNGSDSDGASSESDDERATMNNVLASKESLRNRAVDFWHAVGWAFNCSVKYTDRWKYWKIWLEYMLDVLDADWIERERQDQAIFNSRKEDPRAELEYEKVKGSMIVRYLSEAQGRSEVRRIVKAAFADGGADMLKAYPAVFENETRDKKRKRDQGASNPARSYDIHDDEDDTFDASNPEEETLESTEDMDEMEVERASLLGGLESIHLRQRVLGLISRVAAILPDSFQPAKEVYKFYIDYFKVLPVPAFSLFISPSMQQFFLPEVLCSLDQLLLDRLMQNTPCRPRTKNDEISQDILEERFLPFCANTSSSEDNAKVSILVESLLRLFMVADCQVYHTSSLVEAVEKGIQAREKNTKSDRRKKNSAARMKVEEADKLCLQVSAKRLRSLLAWVERQGA